MATTWRVTGQRQFEELTGAGQFVPVIEVTFELVGSGTAGTVKIPARQYSEEYVREVVDAAAQNMAAVERLSG